MAEESNTPGRFIGTCTREAIDVVQDISGSSRPLAEQTFFSMLKEGKVRLAYDEYILMEADEEVRIRSNTTAHKRARAGMRYRQHRLSSMLQKKQGSLNWAPDNPDDVERIPNALA